MQMTCPRCSTANDSGVDICEGCGWDLREVYLGAPRAAESSQESVGIRVCLRCRAENEGAAGFCTSCGSDQLSAAEPIAEPPTAESSHAHAPSSAARVERDVRVCFRCNTLNHPEASECSSCGSTILSDVRAVAEEAAPLAQTQHSHGGRYCGSCGAPAYDDARFCAACGQTLDSLPASVYCSRCGTQNESSSGFCAACGAGLRRVAELAPQGPPPAATGTHQHDPPRYQPPPRPPAGSYSGSRPSYAQPPQGARHLVYVGFWRRLAAVIIDLLVLLIPYVVVWVIAIVIFGNGTGGYVVAGIVSYVLEGFYYMMMETSHHQGTLGKKAIGAKVTDENGRPITPDQALTRYVVKEIPSILAIIPFFLTGWIALLVLVAWAIILGASKRKQGLHDQIAKTLVVDK